MPHLQRGRVPWRVSSSLFATGGRGCQGYGKWHSIVQWAFGSQTYLVSLCVCVCVSLSLSLSFCPWLWLLGYCLLFLLFLFSFFFGFKFFFFFSFYLFLLLLNFFKKIHRLQCKEDPSHCGLLWLLWVVGFFHKSFKNFLAGCNCQEACSRSFFLSFSLARGILSQLWLRCYMNIKLMSFHVCFGWFYLFFSLCLCLSLPPCIRIWWRNSKEVCVCGVCVLPPHLFNCEPKENKKSYWNLDTDQVCVHPTGRRDTPRMMDTFAARGNQHPHKGTIHWMPMVTQLRMNLNGVNTWIFTLETHSCKK
jgi:hypothetical protein